MIPKEKKDAEYVSVFTHSSPKTELLNHYNYSVIILLVLY